MPALNISEEQMKKVEEIVDIMEISPTKREVGNKAIDELYNSVVGSEENSN